MKPELIVIGTSLGGLTAVETLLAELPRDFPFPIAIVQHRSAESREGLARALRRHSLLPVQEPQDKEQIVPGRVYLAPADYHLLVERGAFALSTEGPVRCARPSIDALFESAAAVYSEGVVAVVLTGASDDGARGAAVVKSRGGVVLVQDPQTAESSVMPAAALKAADQVLSLPEIARVLIELGTTG